LAGGVKPARGNEVRECPADASWRASGMTAWSFRRSALAPATGAFHIALVAYRRERRPLETVRSERSRLLEQLDKPEIQIILADNRAAAVTSPRTARIHLQAAAAA